MSGKRPRSADEIKNSFNHQCDYLYRSCRAFDAGQENEALRLSTTLRVLLHQTPKSNSLLNQMNLLTSLAYVDSGARRASLIQVLNQQAPAGMVYNFDIADTLLVFSSVIGDEIKFIAPLMRSRFVTADPKHAAVVPTRSYKDWWEDRFMEVTNGHAFSRKDIVLALANKEGGTHLDPDIEIKFDDLYQDNLGTEAGTDSIPFQKVKPNIAYATVRQIAYEVMATFDDHFGTDLIEKTQKSSDRPAWFAVPRMTVYTGNSGS